MVANVEAAAEAAFGALLHRYRLAAGLTQEALAERAGLSARAISDLERGERTRPQRATVARLAGALGLGPAERRALAGAVERRRGPAAARAGPLADGPPDNLPAPLTSFVGRERELAEAARRLETARLVTLTGPGGVGKTRLALRAAAATTREERPDGVRLVELAALADPALLPQTVAAALGVREEPQRPLLATLAAALRAKRLLLILDNCEHLVGACAALVEHLLRACPGLRILATSRVALRLDGEATYVVPPLSLPDAGQPPSPDGMARSEAVHLFLDRAASCQPGFALTPDNAAAVARVCRQLDGVPLAIELAAAYLRGLSVAQLAARLDRRLEVLRQGARTAAPRHRTLRAVVDWSYDLLGERERALFARLAVFAGGFTLPAAEAVCGGGELASTEVLQALVRLVEASLVMADPGGERYRLLDTVREYAGERLEGSGLETSIRGRHADYYLALAEGAAAHGRGPDGQAWRPFAAERANLRQALAWFRGRDPARGLRLAVAHERFWYVHGYAREGRAWLEALLDRAPERTALRATALLNLAGLCELQRELDQARRCAEEGLTLAREAGDRPVTRRALGALGLLASGSGDLARARARLEESLALAREAGVAAELIHALRVAALLAMADLDFGRARALLEESLAVARATGDRRGVAAALGRLGALARLAGDYPRARALLEEGIAAARAIDHRPAAGTFLASLGNLARCEGDAAAARRGLAAALRAAPLPVLAVTCLGSFGVLAIHSGAAERGVRLLAAASRHDPTLNSMHFPELAIDCRESLPRARAALGAARFRQAWSAGQALTPDQAIAEALADGP